MAKLNLFKTKNGTYFVSPDKELKESSLIKVKGLIKGWGQAQTLINLLWTKKSIDEVAFLTSYGSLKEAEAFIQADKNQLEEAFI